MKVIEEIYLTGIPHKGKELTFKHPPFRGYYRDVAKVIDKAGLKRPNSSETASLFYDALQNPKGKYEFKIINLLENKWLWEFTGNLYLPKSNKEINNGVILDLNPKIEGGKLSMNKNDLIKRLNKNDSNVKFVSFGFKIGEQTWKELGKNPYILARYGEEGAEKIAEIASKYKKNPKLWSFDSVDNEKIIMSALLINWYSDIRLHVDGDYWGEDGNGHAFGVKK